MEPTECPRVSHRLGLSLSRLWLARPAITVRMVLEDACDRPRDA